ncbi:MAG: trypsin-like peptidase domain-containing protein [Planctomycetes bacterium]|nr:trypsin-like peptidase domain-containing protein [Planctomycetota bacterium]
MRRTLLLPVLLLLVAMPARADDKPPTEAKTVEQVAEQVRKSVVVITVPGRDGKRGGLGTGFVVGEGLVATNLHVVGEGRAVTVELADGKRHEATAVHAFDRNLDLAIVRIDAKGLPALPLADSAAVKDGQQVVAMGNPHGLKHSVVAGVVSSRRDVEGRPMLQVAIPVEPGNSGGPLVDMQGRVVGIMTAKSAVTDNLGFAVAANALKPLLKKPNPVTMAAWLTIGALDVDDWKPMLGSRWRQRAGRIIAETPGSGFGGRSYCLSLVEVPKLPFEVAVTVKLDDEAGAAGLIFHDDGSGRHYGFYPSGGGLRLTRFDGPDVFTWQILVQKQSPHYRSGEWNTIKVRLDKDGIHCYVNDHLIIESDDAVRTEGRVGLAKFRDTRAEFKQFQVGKKLTSSAVSSEVAARVRKALDALGPEAKVGPETLRKLGGEGSAGLAALRTRAKQLEDEAARLRKLVSAVHQQGVQDELVKVLSAKDGKIDLLHAALLIAKLDNDELNVEVYRRDVDRMAKKVASRLPKDADEKAKLAALNKYLFEERGFHGSRGDYYNKANSYLNEVLDDREGLPITLSVVYIELGRRLGLKVEGVGLPGHFVVRHVPKKGEPQLIDVYEGGKALSRDTAAKKVEDITGRKLEDQHLAAVAPRDIIVRMLNNLLNLAQRDRDLDGTLRYLDTIIVAAPEDSGRERGLRALTRYQGGDREGALKDLDWVLEKMPEGIDLDVVRNLRQRMSGPGR